MPINAVLIVAWPVGLVRWPGSLAWLPLLIPEYLPSRIEDRDSNWLDKIMTIEREYVRLLVIVRISSVVSFDGHVLCQ